MSLYQTQSASNRLTIIAEQLRELATELGELRVIWEENKRMYQEIITAGVEE